MVGNIQSELEKKMVNLRIDLLDMVNFGYELSNILNNHGDLEGWGTIEEGEIEAKWDIENKEVEIQNALDILDDFSKWLENLSDYVGKFYPNDYKEMIR